MPTNQQHKNILVVDDEPAVRELLRDCLEIEGFTVTEACNGSELNTALEQQPFDLITLDLNLGGENGFDLVREIRATRNIPIVMITGKGDPIDRIVGLELGADDYIAKPFQLREVVAGSGPCYVAITAFLTHRATPRRRKTATNATRSANLS